VQPAHSFLESVEPRVVVPRTLFAARQSSHGTSLFGFLPLAGLVSWLSLLIEVICGWPA